MNYIKQRIVKYSYKNGITSGIVKDLLDRVKATTVVDGVTYPTSEVVDIERLANMYAIENGTLVGYWYAFKAEDNKVHIGYSMCCDEDQDEFNKEVALKIAMGRAISCYEKGLNIPRSLYNDFLLFYNRCARYFTDGTLPEEWKIFNNAVRKYEVR